MVLTILSGVNYLVKNIDIFSKFNYDDKCDFQFGGIPYLDINSQFPIDYRSKDDIIKCVESTEQAMQIEE